MSNDIIVCGKNNVVDAIKTKDVSKIYLTNENKRKDVLELISQHNIPFVVVDKFYLSKLTENATHQGIAAVMSPITYLTEKELIKKNEAKVNPMVIMLDEVTDVNNLGSVLRIIDAFDCDGLIFNKRRNAQINASVAKISTGAVNHVDICRVTNLSNTIKDFKKAGYWVACLDMDGTVKAGDFAYDMPLVVIVGGEDKGITPNIKKQCDFSLKIDMFGHVNSLNVASATTLLCYEKSKKR